MVNKLEVAWTLVTVGLIAGVAVYSTVLLYSVDALPSHPGEYVEVTGHQWYWEFHYPANNTWWNVTYDPTTQSASGGALWAHAGETVQINVTSVDVVHSFNIPGLGVRIDAIPGRTNHFAFAVPSGVPSGTQYLIQCTEFCGTFHGIMRAYLVVQ
jgi:cytochrome c oxidase subunit II